MTFKEILEKHSLKQAEIAQLLGVSAGTVGNWARGYSAPKAQIKYLLERIFPDLKWH